MTGLRDVAVVLSALVVVSAVGATAGIAISTTDDTTTYTGCLMNGQLKDVAVGDSPARPCRKNAEEVSWNAQGPPGADGTTWHNGESVPASDLGSNGDLYLHLTTGDVYVKDGGVWGKRANIRGPEGPKGDRGEVGPEGPKGDQGESGPPGVSRAIVVANNSMDRSLSADGEEVIEAIELESGKAYTVFATVGSDDREFVNCRLKGYRINASGHLVLDRASIDQAGSTSLGAIPLMGGYEAPFDDDGVGVAVVCSAPDPTAHVTDLRLVVHEVDELTVTNRHFE